MPSHFYLSKHFKTFQNISKRFEGSDYTMSIKGAVSLRSTGHGIRVLVLD